jgi:hypothetical protein
MSSNAYIATDGESLLKVGKANNIKKREQQIGLPITIYLGCPDEEVALLIETEFRRIVIEMGGVRHASGVDWFEYDKDIYFMLMAFAQSLDGFKPASIQGLPNPEITRRRKEYIQQLKVLRHKMIKEYLAERDNTEIEIRSLKARITSLEEQRAELRQELNNEREKVYKLIREIGYMEGRLKGLIGWAREREQKPLEASILVDILNSLIPDDAKD